MKVLPNGDFIETTGSRLAHGGVAEIKSHIEKLLAAEGGVIFVDEAYQLVEAHNPSGKSVLDFMLAEIENQVGKIVFILAGYTRQMEKFFEHNPGLPSRIPYKFQFDDYEDDELLQMLWRIIDKKYQGKMKIEGGRGGLYMRILISRLGRGRGRALPNPSRPLPLPRRLIRIRMYRPPLPPSIFILPWYFLSMRPHSI